MKEIGGKRIFKDFSQTKCPYVRSIYINVKCNVNISFNTQLINYLTTIASKECCLRLRLSHHVRDAAFCL